LAFIKRFVYINIVVNWIYFTAELYLNANNYTHHPKLLASIEDPEINYEPETLFSILLTDEAACAETTDRMSAVENVSTLI
jgi:hypothetical protein